MGWVLGVVVPLAGLAVLAFLAAGPERVWWALAGNPDPGPVVFASLDRSRWPNNILVCPRDFCRLATPDIVSPVYAIPADALLAAAVATMESRPRTTRVDDRADPLKARFIVRSPLLRFPDAVSIEAVPIAPAAGEPGSEPPATSAIAVFSESRIGSYDFGANAVRVQGLLRDLAGRVPVARSVGSR